MKREFSKYRERGFDVAEFVDVMVRQLTNSSFDSGTAEEREEEREEREALVAKLAELFTQVDVNGVPIRPLSDAFDRLCSRTVAPTLGRHSGETVGAGVRANVGAGCGRRRSEGALLHPSRPKPCSKSSKVSF